MVTKVPKSSGREDQGKECFEVNEESNNQALIAQMVAQIEAADLRNKAEDAGFNSFGASFTEAIYKEMSSPMSSVSASVMAQDIEEARKWVASIEEFELRADDSGSSASEWASVIENTNARDSAVESYAQSLYREDPVGAAEWLESISNDPAMGDAASQMSMALGSSASQSRGAPGGGRGSGR